MAFRILLAECSSATAGPALEKASENAKAHALVEGRKRIAGVISISFVWERRD